MHRFISLFALMAVAFTAMAQYKTAENIPYVPTDDPSQYRRERCVLDVYYPEGKKDFKTIVWLHGGGLEGGQKHIPEEFKNQGIAVVAVNYRLFPKCKNPEYTIDAAAAVAWTVNHIAQYGGDPRQVYVAGHSAGGYLTLMLALDKTYLGAHGIDADSLAGYYPISGQTATHYTIRKERGIPTDIPIIDRYAPLNHARHLTAPMMLITGDRHYEMMSRYEENLYLKSVLDGVGKQNIPLYEVQGMDHCTVLPAAYHIILNHILHLQRF
ncbi:MAG: alpha/beta hydrolase [Bacteroidales bacterium]|nr:alpha/beta hydrolase [Bacteroidales bacterium]